MFGAGQASSLLEEEKGLKYDKADVWLLGGEPAYVKVPACEYTHLLGECASFPSITLTAIESWTRVLTRAAAFPGLILLQAGYGLANEIACAQAYSHLCPVTSKSPWSHEAASQSAFALCQS